MNGAGDEFLACAGFTENEDGGIRRGDDFDLLLDEAEAAAGADDFAKVVRDGAAGFLDAFVAIPDGEVLYERDPTEGAELDYGSSDEDWNADAILADEFLFVGGAGSKAEAIFVGEFIERSVLQRRNIGPAHLSGGDVFAGVADDIEEGIVDNRVMVELAGDDADDGGLRDLGVAAGAFAADLLVELVAFREVADDAGVPMENTGGIPEGHGHGVRPEERTIVAAMPAFGADVAGRDGSIELPVQAIAQAVPFGIEKGDVMGKGVLRGIPVEASGAGVPGCNGAGAIEEEEGVILGPGGGWGWFRRGRLVPKCDDVADGEDIALCRELHLSGAAIGTEQLNRAFLFAVGEERLPKLGNKGFQRGRGEVMQFLTCETLTGESEEPGRSDASFLITGLIVGDEDGR